MTGARKPLPIYRGADAGMRPIAREQVFAAAESGADVRAIVERIARGLDAMWAQTASRAACAERCSHCCHQRVEVTAPEVLWLADRLRARSSALPSVRARIAATRDRLAGLSSREHHLRQIRCALLDDDGACGVYDARPLACRRAHSVDASVCRDVHHDPTLDVRVPDDPALSWNTAALVLGYREGIEHAGRPLDTYELHAALLVALDDDAAGEKWSRGEDPFAEARTRTAEEIRTLITG